VSPSPVCLSEACQPRGTLSGMEKQAVIRRIRLAVSLFFGLLTVALCLLWMCGEWQCELVEARTGAKWPVLGSSGRTEIFCFLPLDSNWLADSEWRIAIGKSFPDYGATPPKLGFSYTWDVAGVYTSLPYALPVFFCAAVTAAVWRPRLLRFSVRTLLIATTLVAVVLGLVCYYAR
jgi:hypothetical protein